MAAEYQSAKTLGIDLTPPQNPQGTPRNCSFVQVNVEKPWTFPVPTDKFDFIYARMLCNGIHDWPQLFARCFQNLKPGGWIEIPDVKGGGLAAKDGSCAKISPAIRWFQLFRAASMKRGIDPDANQKHGHRLREAGFVRVKEAFIEWPIGGAGGTTGKEEQMGIMHLETLSALIDGRISSP